MKEYGNQIFKIHINYIYSKLNTRMQKLLINEMTNRNFSNTSIAAAVTGATAVAGYGIAAVKAGLGAETTTCETYQQHETPCICQRLYPLQIFIPHLVSMCSLN